MPARGFTLVELIAVILIAGILAAIATPRFFNANTFAARGYFNEAAGFLRYAQKLAVARHTDIYVQADANGLTLCAIAAAPCVGANRIVGPDGEPSYKAHIPSDGGVNFDGAGKSFSFDDQGRPSAGRSFTIAGEESLTLTVEAETGYVH